MPRRKNDTLHKVSVKRKVSAKNLTGNQSDNIQTREINSEETAYECLLQQVQTKKSKLEEEVEQLAKMLMNWSKIKEKRLRLATEAKQPKKLRQWQGFKRMIIM